MDRREFLLQSSFATIGLGLAGSMLACKQTETKELFKISLAEWSVNSLIFGGKVQTINWQEFNYLLANDYQSLIKDSPLSNLEFPQFARKLGIDAVEYVNTCFFDKAKDISYLAELNNVCANEGVKSLLIMCDGEGDLGDKDSIKRKQSVENHYKWVDAAAYLGCHSIRVNAQSEGSYKEQINLAADGIHQLCEYANKANINVLVENHGGLSSNGAWLSELMHEVNHKAVGTLPDFGNFILDYNTEKMYDRYKGIEEMMPFAKAVSAKSNDFDEMGNEIHTDYYKAMRLVLDAGYRGYVGIEYDGYQINQTEGIIATKRLLEKVRSELHKTYINSPVG